MPRQSAHDGFLPRHVGHGRAIRQFTINSVTETNIVVPAGIWPQCITITTEDMVNGWIARTTSGDSTKQTLVSSGVPFDIGAPSSIQSRWQPGDIVVIALSQAGTGPLDVTFKA